MGALGLSFVHISTGPALTGSATAEKGVPCNGWGHAEKANGFPELPLAPGDHVGTVRRGRGMVSVGVVPILVRGGTRGKVQRFSSKSASRMVRVLSDAVAPFGYMGTLTVGTNWTRDGVAFKLSVDKFLTWFQKRQSRLDTTEHPGLDAVFWFLEFQARGAPHIHFFYTSRVPWMEAAQKWAECVGTPEIWRTATKFEKLRGGRAGALAYARKYARKREQKDVPADFESVGRFWGLRGCRELVTCHVSALTVDGGLGLVKAVTRVLEAGVEAGLLRRLAWEYGEGACYFAKGGGDLYQVGIGQQIDSILMRFIAR